MVLIASPISLIFRSSSLTTGTRMREQFRFKQAPDPLAHGAQNEGGPVCTYCRLRAHCALPQSMSSVPSISFSCISSTMAYLSVRDRVRVMVRIRVRVKSRLRVRN